MTRRRFVLVLVVVVVLGGVTVFFLFDTTTPKPGPSKANFEQLHRGESRRRFEAALGPPCDELSNHQVTRVVWVAREGRILVIFESTTGEVLNGFMYTQTDCYELCHPPPTLLAEIREVLDL
jgi:hypothetical protein